ncbi:MAG: hypothetical protein IPK68_09735 [Bdellovibrionales bacterium]|nr:hypothetical protein [Bdellovibrionales bacterium]
MSIKYKSHEEYWQDVFPRLQTYLDGETKQDIKDIIFTCLAFYGYLTEDIGQKIRKNQVVNPKLDLFLIFAFDQLRAALVLYENLNLSPLAISARATFENSVSIHFITSNADSAKYADLYHRYKGIVRLKAHRNSLILPSLTEPEINIIKASCPEWFLPDGKLKKNPHWTAIDGMSFEQLVNQVGMKDYYSIYRTTSQFVHASPITVNMYKGPKGMGAIALEKRSKEFALLVCIFSLEILKDYLLFFDVEFDQGYFLGLMKKLNELSQ